MPKGKKPALDTAEEDDDQVSGDMNAQIAQSLAANPLLLQAVQDRLNGLVGASSGYVENLPESVKRRLNALKNIQVECASIEGKFYSDVHALEMKYAKLYEPLYSKRKAIINGEHEPTDEEAKWVEPGLDEESEKEDEKATADEAKEEANEEDNEKKVKKMESQTDMLAEELKEKVVVEGDPKDEEADGIPEFWLTAMKNVETINEMIQPHDEPILAHLTDMKLILSGRNENGEEASDEELGFALEFHFSQNDYFTNSVLTKSYKMQCHPDSDDPFSFDGTEITGCTGCHIDWKKGKNVTQKTVKKKQKHKGRGQTRTVTKTVKNDSFFNFFDPPEVDGEEMEEDTETLLAADFEIGHFMRERLIPRAVLYFTGEAIEDDEDEFDETGDDDDGDDEELDEDEDPDYKPPDTEKPPECKQQ